MRHLIEAIKVKHNFVSEWTRAHGFNASTVSDLLYRNKSFKDIDCIKNTKNNSYAILVTLLQEGYEEALTADGWDISKIIPELAGPQKVYAHKPGSVSKRKLRIHSLDILGNYCADVCIDTIVIIRVVIQHDLGIKQKFLWKVATAIDFNMLEAAVMSAVDTLKVETDEVSLYFDIL